MLKKIKRAKDQLLINKTIRKLPEKDDQIWKDYKKVYGMVPHSWLKICMIMIEVAENMEKVLVNSREKWKTELTS